MPLYYPSSTTYYTFDSTASADLGAFLWTDPIVTEATAPDFTNTGRRWCWDNSSTPSADIGPTSGEGSTATDGYVYTEMSSPGVGNDVFSFEKTSTSDSTSPISMDAASFSINVDFSSNQRGDDNLAAIQLYTNEAGAGWVARGSDFGGGDVATGGVQIWRQRSVDLTGVVSSTDTRLQFRMTVGSSAGGELMWHNDIGWDRIRISLTDALSNEVKGVTYSHASTSVLGSCTVSLWLDNGDNTVSFKDQITSDSTDGSYVFTGVGSASTLHFITATINTGSSDLMDISDRTVTPSSTYGGSVDLYLRSQVDKSETAGDGDLRLRTQASKISTSTGVAFFGHGLLLSSDRNRLVY